MKTSKSWGKHGLQWTSRMQLDDLDFSDDLLSQSQQQMQEKTTSVASASAAISSLFTGSKFIVTVWI
ncbi:unnamed protein product [Schistosoma margrebowiei]|uniref:Uncharacterized protein n=1 Tax=Schistosoma margrebowiei TaxID=48269 RepID=A0A183MW04_9TREM|nr:unnamed protein product [Schistosoma margrebowiei]